MAEVGRILRPLTVDGWRRLATLFHEANRLSEIVGFDAYVKELEDV